MTWNVIINGQLHVEIEPEINGKIVYGVRGNTNTQNDNTNTIELSLKVRFRNISSVTYILRNITIKFQNASDEIFTIFDNGSGGVVNSISISAGTTDWIFLQRMASFGVTNGYTIRLDPPVSPDIVFDFNIDDQSGNSYNPIFSKPLAKHKNATCFGSYSHWGKLSDLEPGEYWSGTTRIGHVGYNLLAYDVGITKFYNPTGIWITTKQPLAPGNPGTNDDYLVFGKPVYAIASGEIISADDSMDDPAPNSTGANNQNHVKILVDGKEEIIYLHLQKDSIPNNITVGSLVRKGDLIGKVGSQNAPHLHIQVNDLSGSDLPNLPLHLHDTRVMRGIPNDASPKPDPLNSSGNNGIRLVNSALPFWKNEDVLLHLPGSLSYSVRNYAASTGTNVPFSVKIDLFQNDNNDKSVLSLFE